MECFNGMGKSMDGSRKAGLDQHIARKRDEVIRRMIAMPPIPHFPSWTISTWSYQGFHSREIRSGGERC